MFRLYSSIIIFYAILVSLSCIDLDHSNPLDPKNKHSEAPRRVLVEAFVVDVDNAAILSALGGLQRLTYNYSVDQFLLLEHHIQKTPGKDSLALSACLTRYQNLVPQPASQAIPDVFFDGLTSRVQGASDIDAAYARYSAAIEASLQQPAKMTIDANADLLSNELHLRISLARLGSKDAEDVVVYVALTSKVYPSRPVVRVFLMVEAPGLIKAGKTIKIDRKVNLTSGIKWIEPECVLVIQNSSTQEIYHCALADMQLQ